MSSTPLERDVMEYAEAMTQTPPTVTDEQSAGLLAALGPAALVELTAFIALANLYTRTKHRVRHRIPGVLGRLWPQAARHSLDGMTDDPFVTHRSCSSPSPTRCSALPPTPRTSSRRPGCGGPTWTRPRFMTARLSGPDRHPAGAEPAPVGVPPPGGVHRGMAARAAAHQSRCGRGRRARRERLDRDAHRAGDPRSGRAGSVRAARGVRDAVRRDRRGGGQDPGRGPADRAHVPATTSGRGGRGCRWTGPSSRQPSRS